MIDLDEISLVHPNQGRSFARENLRAIWPRHAAVPGLRLLLPGVIADEGELVLLRDALPGADLAVCELTAPQTVLKERVTARSSKRSVGSPHGNSLTWPNTGRTRASPTPGPCTHCPRRSPIPARSRTSVERLDHLCVPGYACGAG